MGVALLFFALGRVGEACHLAGGPDISARKAKWPV
jgi:hypothetical protein